MKKLSMPKSKRLARKPSRKRTGEAARTRGFIVRCESFQVAGVEQINLPDSKRGRVGYRGPNREQSANRHRPETGTLGDDASGRTAQEDPCHSECAGVREDRDKRSSASRDWREELTGRG